MIFIILIIYLKNINKKYLMISYLFIKKYENIDYI